MEYKLHTLCTIMFLVMVTSHVRVQGLTQCIWDSKTCSCKTDRGTISLAPLSLSKPFEIADEANNQTFYWSPCKDYTFSEAGITAGAIQQQGTPSQHMYYELGTHAHGNSDISIDGHARFYMSASDHQRIIFVKCLCAEGFDLKFIEEMPRMNYHFVLATDQCCPV